MTSERTIEPPPSSERVADRMVTRMRKGPSFQKSVTLHNSVEAEEVRSSECILARLIATAYAADHPELFGQPQFGSSQLTELCAVRTLQARQDHQLCA